MKKTTFFTAIFIIASIFTSQTQAYNLTFTGSGASTSVGDVEVRNLSTGTLVTVPAGNVLHLTVVTSLETPIVDSQDIQVVPNGLQGNYSISFSSKQAGITHINAYSLNGSEIASAKVTLMSGINTFKLSLPTGISVIQVSGNGYSYSTKIVSNGSKVEKSSINYVGNNQSQKVSLGELPPATNLLFIEGQRLLFKARSGNYSTIVTDIPTENKNINFEFHECVDSDNNNYTTVTIGTQVWMAENLRTTNNGRLANVTEPMLWSGACFSRPLYCDYYNNPSNSTTHGRLYNWYAALTIAPKGWHLPTRAEWDKLQAYCGGESAGDKLKETETDGYMVGFNTGGTNQYGFSAIVAGSRNCYGEFYYGAFDTSLICNYGNWWSNEAVGSMEAWSYGIWHNYNRVTRNITPMGYGLSVRCVKN